MKKIEIKNIHGVVLFSLEEDNNTLKHTLEEAIKNKIDLSFAVFYMFNLSNMNLKGMKLRNCHFIQGSFQNTNINDADLSGSTFKHVCLFGTTFIDSNLTNVIFDSNSMFNTNFQGANFKNFKSRFTSYSNANLLFAENLKFAYCAFPAHGECGRQLTAIIFDKEIELYCGCFKGSVEDLQYYIETGFPSYRKSRLFALKTVLELINFKDG